MRFNDRNARLLAKAKDAEELGSGLSPKALSGPYKENEGKIISELAGMGFNKEVTDGVRNRIAQLGAETSWRKLGV